MSEAKMQELIAELLSGDDERAEKTIPALVGFGMAAHSALLDLTRAADVDSRWWGVRALAASPHTQTEDLLPLLSDSAPEVRAATALALCNHPHEAAVEALVQALADEDPLTAGLAGTALGKIGAPSVPSLLKVMSEAPVGVKILALRALSEIKDHRAIPVMMKSMGEESALLQYWAQEGLERLGLNMVYVKP
ncbi:MAG TPA: HEAT repeat domain-containing protein [Anaerolineales bacterium]|nr:HEAT repeat domain-containing protein [Anaerolineales bacterium]HNF34994.1 HEAT repeat domain-containing protein [Anaerolineales bacterium]